MHSFDKQQQHWYISSINLRETGILPISCFSRFEDGLHFRLINKCLVDIPTSPVLIAASIDDRVSSQNASGDCPLCENSLSRSPFLQVVKVGGAATDATGIGVLIVLSCIGAARIRALVV